MVQPITQQDLDKTLKKALENVATKDDLKNFATKDDLKNFATKDDLQNTETRIIKRINAVHDEVIVNRGAFLRHASGKKEWEHDL
ncbi:hypothetical protein KKF38_03840 [Patescibacteria group bacterium]|nr:hypothetical protein [Patescibacteria group bacterium]